MDTLEGKTVIVTGANSGIGKCTAINMAVRGARVIVACRDQGRGDAAVAEIKEESKNNNIELGILDLASLESVKQFAANILQKEERLDILINNAGILGVPKSQTKDGFELHFGVNHLGHFALTLHLLELLKTSAPSRVVNVSSKAHIDGAIKIDDLNLEKGYTPWKAYCQSKVANILFTRTLDEKLQGTGVTTYSLHPGMVNTDIYNHMRQQSCYSCIYNCFSCCCKSPEEGARTTIYCAVAEGIEQHSGKYFADCQLVSASAAGRNDDVAHRLWQVSEELTGVTYSG